MSITLRASFLAAVGLVFATGFTECSSFSSVTIPATDTSKPVAFAGVWRNGSYQATSKSGNTYVYHITPGESVLAIGAGIDGGGTHRLKMTGSFEWTCCSGDICGRTQSLTAPKIDEQAGAVGDSVSNGIWDYFSVELPTCGNGRPPDSFSYGWSAEATDFHGNTSTTGSYAVVYP